MNNISAEATDHIWNMLMLGNVRHIYATLDLFITLCHHILILNLYCTYFPWGSSHTVQVVDDVSIKISTAQNKQQAALCLMGPLIPLKVLLLI